jgi:hypothetical protein
MQQATVSVFSTHTEENMYLTCPYNFLKSTDKERWDVLFFREKVRWQHFGCGTIRLRQTPNQLLQMDLNLLTSHAFINI